MNCPFCGRWHRDLFALSLHLDDDHPGREGELVLAIAEPVREEFGPRPHMPGVDIDAVHRTYGAAARQEG